MSVLEAVKTVGVKTKKSKGFSKQLIYHGAYFLFGLLFSLSGLSEEFSPFGVAFAASSGKKYCLTSSLGASLGYILVTDSVTSLRYIASLLALYVIMSALKPFRTLYDNPVTPVISVFVCLFVTGLAVVFSKDVTVLSLLVCFSEAIIGAVSSHLFSKSRGLLNLKGSLLALTSKEATTLVISGVLLLLSIKNISLFGIFPAHIIAELFILVCAFYGKEAGGTIVGVSGGVALSFGSGNIFLLAFYAFGGLLAGAAGILGRIASFAAFVFAGLSVSVIAYGKIDDINIVTETVIAGVMFLLIPKKVTVRLDELLSPKINSPIIDSVKNDITRKLKNASEISSGICTSITTVTDALSKSEKADMKNIYKKTKESVCGSCGLFDVCWNESFDDTKASFNTLVGLKKEGVYLEYKTVPREFSGKCIRTEMVASSFNRLYAEYKIKERMESRISEIHTLAAEQFINVSSLLDSLCDKLCEEVRFDMDISARARAAASSAGFEPLESCCTINSLEKLTLELTVKTPSGKVEISALTKQLEAVTDRKLELPSITRDESSTVFVYKEKSDLKIAASGVQSCSRGEKYSGDTFSTFTDDDGMFYAVICDGMGTGMKAAVSSNLAVSLIEKLIKAGFGIEAAINTVNTSLISKSGDECSVTLDLTVVDTFTGHTSFYKCGAADTVVRKSGRLFNISCPSLPLGIIKDAESAYGSGVLGAGDIIVMVSDGVREEDFSMLKSEVKSFGGGNVRTFTQELTELIRQSQPERNDDLTVVTLAVTDNE